MLTTRDAPDGTGVPLDTVIRVAEFRAGLRVFMRRNEEVARSCGLTPQRYLLLLMIKGAPDGSERASFTALAERLQLDRTSVTELVRRAERAGLVHREPSTADRRVVYLRLTEEGEQSLVAALAALDADRRRLAVSFRRMARTFDASSSASQRHAPRERDSLE